MKKILLLSVLGLYASLLQAQITLFEQTFGTDAVDAAAVAAAYVRTNTTPTQIAIGDNMFTRLAPFGTNSQTKVSVSGGKLKLERLGGFVSANNGNADYQITASRTVSGAGGSNPNARLTTSGPQVLKMSMDISLSDFVAFPNSGMVNAVLFFVGGDALNQHGNDNPVPGSANSSNYHSVLGITTNATGNTYYFSNPQGLGNQGSVATGDANTTNSINKGTTVNLVWYINNSGSSMTYTGPGPGGTSKTLDNGHWDLYAKIDGATSYNHILVNRKSNGTATAINNMALQVRQINSYSDTPNDASTFRANPLTVEIDNWVAEDITGSVTLPVTLTSFVAKATGNTVKLNWETANEENNSHFVIEASVNDKDFKKIGTVLSKAKDGNSSIPLQYEFSFSGGSASIAAMALLVCLLPLGRRFHKRVIITIMMVLAIGFIACHKGGDTVNVSSDNLYFRIGWVDKDGGIKYSKVVKAVQE